jgi:hypothetical protein
MPKKPARKDKNPKVLLGKLDPEQVQRHMYPLGKPSTSGTCNEKPSGERKREQPLWLPWGHGLGVRHRPWTGPGPSWAEELTRRQLRCCNMTSESQINSLSSRFLVYKMELKHKLVGSIALNLTTRKLLHA